YGQNRTTIVEYSSPNIAKPFHIGHIRTTVIGHSLHRLYKFLGFNTIAINHLGDYGTQFGKLIVAYKAWGDREIIEKDPISELLKLYIEFHDRAEEEPEMEDQARAWFKKLEDGDQEATELWQWIRDVSLKEFNKVYEMLGIEYDSFAGESFYSDKMPRVIKMMEEKGILKDSQGAKIVDLEEYGMPPALVMKKDGSTLYITRDIAAAIYRKETYNFYKNIYVVGTPQELHFRQWKKIIELMGNDWADDCVHVQFGTVSLEDGTLSSRKGRVVFLEDVLSRAIEKTKEIIVQKNPDLENIDLVAKQVGVGAIVFQELSNSRIKDYQFSWERTLSFEGETGPYVQYTHTRCCSILRKVGITADTDINYSLLAANEDVMDIVRVLASFDDVLLRAQSKNEPHHVARFALDLSQAFNKFYHDNHIINSEEEYKKAYIGVLESTRVALKNAMWILGMEAPEKM
ncbi:MAG: arginine--tRNA ligase, partial [Proteocatella sp.]